MSAAKPELGHDLEVMLRCLRTYNGVPEGAVAKLEGAIARRLEVTDGAGRIAAERRRQATEGWTAEHDDKRNKGYELALAAIAYATPPSHSTSAEKRICAVLHSEGKPRPAYCNEFMANLPSIHVTDPWPVTWDAKHDKRQRHDYERRLVIAGALIAAELDRLAREAARACSGFAGRAKGPPCCSMAGNYWKVGCDDSPNRTCGCACHD